MNKRRRSRIPYLVSFLLKAGILSLIFLVNGVARAENRLSEHASFAFHGQSVVIDRSGEDASFYENVSLGEIDFHIGAPVGSNSVTANVSLQDVFYDASHDLEVVGNHLDEFKDLMPNADGPWNLGIRFALEKEAFQNTLDSASYYEITFGGKTYASQLISSGDAKRVVTDTVSLSKGASASFGIRFGSFEHNSTLPEGKYRLHVSLSRQELIGNEAVEKIGLGSVMKLAFLSYRHALFHLTLQDVFNFNNILGLVAIVYAVATLFYFYPDGRSALRVVEKWMSDSAPASKTVVVTTFRDPYSGRTWTETKGGTSGPSIVLAILVGFLYFVLLIALIPIRFVIFLFKDLVYGISGKKPFAPLYGLGCFLGSAGLWSILGAAALFVATNWIFGAVLAAAGIAGLIGAHFLASEDHLAEEDQN